MRVLKFRDVFHRNPNCWLVEMQMKSVAFAHNAKQPGLVEKPGCCETVDDLLIII